MCTENFVRSYNTLLRILGRSDNPHKVIEIYENEIKKQNLPMDHHTYDLILGAALKARQPGEKIDYKLGMKIIEGMVWLLL